MLITVLLNAFHLAKYGIAIGGEVFFGNGLKTEDASFGRNGQNFCHERLDKGGVALVGDRQKLGGQGTDGENIGRFEGACQKEACRVLDVDHDAALRSRISLTEII